GPQPHHPAQVVRREEEGHLADLLDADPVLPGQAAAERDARLEDLLARREHAPHLAGVALVEEDDRVDVAVAGVEDVPDPEGVALADRRDRPHDVRDPRPRHDAVLRAVVRRQAPDGAEGALPALPEERALRLVARATDLARAMPQADVGDRARMLVEAGRGPVDLDDQDRARVDREAGPERRLDRLEDEAIHHLESRRHDSG